MGKIDDALKPKPMAAKPVPKMMVKTPGPFGILFGFDSSKLDAAAGQ